MLGKTKERWRELCEQASVEQDPNEQDPKKLLALVAEINKLLDEKHVRLPATRRRNVNPREGTISKLIWVRPRARL